MDWFPNAGKAQFTRSLIRIDIESSPMSEQPKQVFKMDEAFGFLNLIDLPRLVEETDETWFNQTLCRVNDCVARLGILHGEFHWHHHDVEDEMFFVLSGKLFVDVRDPENGEDSTIEVLPHQGYTVPRKVVHRTRCPEKTVLLMFEGAGVKPKGD